MPVMRTLVVPGLPHVDNKAALDWGWKGLIAYGCQSVVVVIDPRTVQPLQTLSHHRSTVTRVCWSRDRQHHTLATPYSLRLASVDSGSTCVVWDVGQASVISEFSLGAKPLIDMQWINADDTTQDLLAVMLTTSTLTIWSSSTGSKINRVTFSETIEAFTFSPFHSEILVLQSPECFIFVSDFNTSRTPTTGGGRKFYMTKSTANNSLQVASRNKTAGPTWKLLSSENLKGEESIPQVDCRKIVFSPAQKHHLLIVYPREIVVMDTEIRQAIGSISIERNSSPLLHVMPSRHRNVLFCLHENGSVSMRMHQTAPLPSSLPASSLEPHMQVPSVTYSHCCSSEPLRISKLCSVFSGVLCPSTEKSVAVMTSEGRILVWEVEFEQVGLHGQAFPDDAFPPTLLSACPVEPGLVDLPGERSHTLPTERLTLTDTIAPHWFSPPEGCPSTYAYLSARMVLNGMWCGINGHPTAVRMCPPLTTKNWAFYVPQMAVGTSSGVLYVVSLRTESVVQEISVHTCPVRGIEWLSQHTFVSWGHSSPTFPSQLRNEICVTDIRTGRVTPLSRGDPETTSHTPIETVRVSSHKNYLVAKYKDRPLEFWDAKSLTFMRELVSNPPTFSCVEWYPTHSKSKAHRHNDTADTLMPVDFDVAMGAGEGKMSGVYQEKELLNVMDEVGSLWQISIEGSRVRVVHGTPLALPLNNPCGMSFKGDQMVSGDGDGNIAFLENSQWKTIETHRGPIRKLRFAPGKGNFKLFVLYASRLETRDTRSHSSKTTPSKPITLLLSDTVLGHLKWGSKDANCHFSVEDADWATSDKPIVLGSDRCVRVYDSELRICHSVLNVLEMKEPVFCPHVVLPQASLRVKAMLQHQPWNLEYSLDPSEVDDMDSIEKAVKHLLTILPEGYREALTDASLGTPQRAVITASLYGDQRELEFWSVAQYYLLREKHRLSDPRYSVYKQLVPSQPVSDIIRPNSSASVTLAPSSAPRGGSLGDKRVEDFFGPLGDSSGAETPSPVSSHSAISFPPSATTTPPPPPPLLTQREVKAMLRETHLKTLSLTPPLDLCHDLFTDADTYQKVQLYRVLLHDSKRQTYEQTRRCAETLLLLSQTDRAVHLLLETDSSSRDYYTDALKACLAATIRSSGASQSTIKLVATNLIANSRIMDGVQLLCLIDKGLDGCRYLQTYGEWRTAAWLARATLSERDCSEVFTKWADHLASVTVNMKEKALLVLLTLGNFVKIIEMLYGMRYFDQAAVFTEACLEYGLIPRNTQTSAVIEAVFLEYARYLQSLGLSRGMRHYCSKAGEKGKRLLEQYHSSGLKMPASYNVETEPT